MRMKRNLIRHIVFSLGLLAFLFMANPLFSQYHFTVTPGFNSSPQYTPEGDTYDIDYNHTYLTLQSEASFNSNGINNDYINQFYNGNYLSTDLKTQNLNRLKEQKNLIGYNWVTQLRINIPSRKKGISYYAAFENHNYGELCFDKNLFQLVFFGNKDLAGQNAYLDKQYFTLMNFQQIKAGVIKTWFGKAKVNVLTAGLGINNGQSLLSYSIPKGNFFTHSNAEYLALDLQMNMQRSDTLSSKFGAENGLGMCLDMSFFHRDAHSSFEIKMENLGFISWNKHSQQFKKDTLITFDGIDIANIFDLNTETISVFSGDSLKDEFVYSDKTSRFTRMIPMKGSINYTRYLLQDRLSLSLSLINYHFLHFNPLIRFEPTYRIHVKRSLVCISPNIEYGGYGRLNYGLGLSASINSKFFFELRTDYLNGFLDVKRSAGLGAYVSIIKTL